MILTERKKERKKAITTHVSTRIRQCVDKHTCEIFHPLNGIPVSQPPAVDISIGWRLQQQQADDQEIIQTIYHIPNEIKPNIKSSEY
jgi:hypothetical protein